MRNALSGGPEDYERMDTPVRQQRVDRFDSSSTLMSCGAGQFFTETTMRTRSKISTPSTSYSSQTVRKNGSVQESIDDIGDDMKPEDIKTANCRGAMLFSDEDRTSEVGDTRPVITKLWLSFTDTWVTLLLW